MGIKHKIKYGWMQWRKASGILCDKRILMRLKVIFYRNVVKPTMPYSMEGYAVYRKIEQSMRVAGMRML